MSVLRRYRGLLFLAATVCIVVSVSVGMGIGPLYLAGVVLWLLWFGLWFSGSRAQRPPELKRGRAEGVRRAVLIGQPMAGRWSALNGPAAKVPSHGTHDLGQTYAIDLLYEPSGLSAERKRPFHMLWPVVRRPHAYPSFGQPILAPSSGEVVAVLDGRRDHLTRLSFPGILYLTLEGAARSMGPVTALLGNHVVMKLDVESASDGPVYAAFAHLRRGSLKVGVGDRVTGGRQLGECGNSGNSSDPHLHFQLMDGPDLATAKGVLFRWSYVDADGERHVGVPANGTVFSPAPVGDDSGTYPATDLSAHSGATAISSPTSR